MGKNVLFLLQDAFGIFKCTECGGFCNIHVNLFLNSAPFLLGFESIKARPLFVKKSFAQDKKRTLHKVRKSFTRYKINFAQYKLFNQNNLGLTLLTRYQP